MNKDDLYSIVGTPQNSCHYVLLMCGSVVPYGQMFDVVKYFLVEEK